MICLPPPNGWVLITPGAEDTLSSLALKYHTTPDLLAQVNCLIEPDPGANLAPGVQLYVPALTPTPCQPPYWWIKYTV
jgi:hypothetical protein